MTARTFKNFGRLPGRPSELIRLALHDLQAVAEHPDYKIDMFEWHAMKNSACHVCLAGVVIAGTLGAPRRAFRLPSYFQYERPALMALDDFRQGNVWGAFANLGIPPPEQYMPKRAITDYRLNPAQFVSDMERLAADLEKEGY